MSNRVANIVLLVEDRRQENILRHFLHELGHGNRSFRVEKSPKARGSGEQFVREHYAKEVRALRKILGRTKAILVVMIDADTMRPEDRFNQLEMMLSNTEERQWASTTAIFRFAPKRNIETWIRCLNSDEIDEETDFHDHPGIDEMVRGAARALCKWSRRNAEVPEYCVPSLRTSLPEFQRIPHA